MWREIGLTEAQRRERRERIVLHITELLQDMSAEELNLKMKLEESLDSNTAEFMQLCQQLSLKEENMPDASEMPLYQRESFIRGRVDSLNKMKFDRQKRLKRIIEMESSMCKSLGEVSQLKAVYKGDSVPSEEVLKVYRRRVEDLEFTLNERRSIFQDMCSKVQKIWQDLEEEPYGYFSTATKQKDKSPFVLSPTEMTKMEAAYKQIVSEAAQLEGRALGLRQQIESLWTRLNITEEDQLAFNEANKGHKPRVVTRLEEELSRLIELKKENMKLLISNTRSELHKIWDKCLYGDLQRREFSPAFSDEYRDDVLGDLESELDRMSGFYRDNLDLFQKLAKREMMWTQYQELVAKNSDPSRLFNARGGQLLKDQQMQKQVKKDLIKLEKTLTLELKQWEEDCERYFIVKDSRYLDTIKTQWEETGKQKQLEKAKRQMNKEEQTMIEMTYGSKPTTPLKKIMKRPAASPLTVPAKIRKVGQSPCVSSTNSARSLNRPPRGINRATRKTKTPLCTPQKRTQEMKARRVLRDKNSQFPPPDPASESFISQINSSLASTGTYTEFKMGASQQPRSSITPRTSSRTEHS